jgi:hypothetical protein
MRFDQRLLSNDFSEAVSHDLGVGFQYTSPKITKLIFILYLLSYKY